MNLFRHFAGEVADVLGRLVAEGRLPEAGRGRRGAGEPPRGAGRGEVGTHAAPPPSSHHAAPPRAPPPAASPPPQRPEPGRPQSPRGAA